jgi:hypothetical protein
VCWSSPLIGAPRAPEVISSGSLSEMDISPSFRAHGQHVARLASLGEDDPNPFVGRDHDIGFFRVFCSYTFICRY